MKKLLISILLCCCLISGCNNDNNVINPTIPKPVYNCVHLIEELGEKEYRITLIGIDPQIWISENDVPEDFALISTDTTTIIARDWDNCFVLLQTHCFSFVTLLW